MAMIICIAVAASTGMIIGSIRFRPVLTPPIPITTDHTGHPATKEGLPMTLRVIMIVTLIPTSGLVTTNTTR